MIYLTPLDDIQKHSHACTYAHTQILTNVQMSTNATSVLILGSKTCQHNLEDNRLPIS